jgi:HEAT repeat protein
MKSLTSKTCTLALVLISGASTMFAQAPSQTPRQQAWSILQLGVTEKSADKRTEAVRALGIISGDAKAAEIAEHALEDGKPAVRAAAATSLGLMGCTACIGRLKAVLSDKDASVVLAAAHALWTLKDPAAYEVYYAVLTGERKSGEGLVAEGMETLKDRKKMAEFGVEEGLGFIPFAGIGYSAVKVLRKDDVSPVRAAAAAILANDPDSKSGEALVTAASDKSWVVRAAALDAIAIRGDPKLLSGIVPLMFDEKDVVSYNAAAAVIRLSAASGSSKTTKVIKAKQEKKGTKTKKK